LTLINLKRAKSSFFLKGSILCLFFLLTLSPGCSHLKPYYRLDVPRPEQISTTENTLSLRLLLIGDAGEPQEDESVLNTLFQWACEFPAKSMVIFLGDNIYPKGMPERGHPQRPEAERRLLAQINVIRESGARGFFIAGNHDWRGGLQSIIGEAELIQDQLGRGDAFIPEPGCPGPIKMDVDKVRIIVFDNNFWLNRELVPRNSCAHQNIESVFEALKEHISTSGDRHVVLISHYPLDTHGVHGGFYTWKDHLFPLTNLKSWLWVPLPIIGSLYAFLRWNVVKHPQELNSSEYKNMIDKFQEQFALKSPLINAGGHDHSLQVLDGRGCDVKYILVSGAGASANLDPVGHAENTLFAHEHEGFMAVDFLKNGSVWLRVVEPGDREVIFIKKLAGN
jgi:hypothetical protein